MESTTYDDVRSANQSRESPKFDYVYGSSCWKTLPLRIGKSVTRSNLSKANEQRNYRIFEENATFMIAEVRKRRINKIFELDGHVYAFDSTTIDLYLSVFEWTKFANIKVE